MSDFGDWEPDDSFDIETVLDPEQVARRIHELRAEHGESLPAWDDLTPMEKLIALAVVVALIAWLQRQGALR